MTRSVGKHRNNAGTAARPCTDRGGAGTRGILEIKVSELRNHLVSDQQQGTQLLSIPRASSKLCTGPPCSHWERRHVFSHVRDWVCQSSYRPRRLQSCQGITDYSLSFQTHDTDRIKNRRLEQWVKLRVSSGFLSTSVKIIEREIVKQWSGFISVWHIHEDMTNCVIFYGT